MTESGTRGIYEGTYIIQPGEAATRRISVTLKKREVRKEQAKGHLTIDSGGVPRVGLITDDTVAGRTAPDGGYDVFLYKGMHVRLTGKIGSQWRVRLSASQSGWVKESAIQELAPGSVLPQSLVTNITVTHETDSTLIKIPLSSILPYRVEQSLDPPMNATVTLYGASRQNGSHPLRSRRSARAPRALAPNLRRRLPADHRT